MTDAMYIILHTGCLCFKRTCAVADCKKRFFQSCAAGAGCRAPQFSKS